MYNLLEYSDIYSNESRSLWQYYRDEPNANTTESGPLKSKIKIIGKTPDADNNKKNIQIVVPLKYLSNFWKTIEIPLTNCEISFDLTWSKKCVIYSAVGRTEFATTDRKLYVPVLTLSTQDNVKLLKQLASDFKRIIYSNKDHLKSEKLPQNRFLNYLMHVFKE